LKTSEFASILPSLPRGAEVLIIRLRSLGDVVMLTPALAALHSWRPDLRLCVVVEPAFAAVLEGNPAVSEVIRFDGVMSAARRLRSRRFPVTFNQHGGPTSALLTAAVASPVRVCWEHCQFGFFYNVRVADREPTAPERRPHTVEHRLLQFYAAGLPRGPIPRPQVFPQSPAVLSVTEKLRAGGWRAEAPYCVVHPGAAYFTKRWSLQGFAGVVNELKARHGLEAVVVLGPGDGEIHAAAAKQFAKLAPVLDSLTLPELIALAAGARLFLGNDSGPAHVAAAAGCPVAVVFGSSDSSTWRPWQTPHRVVQNDFPCNPCRGDRCYAFDEPRCILSITPEQVRAACDSLLAETE